MARARPAAPAQAGPRISLPIALPFAHNDPAIPPVDGPHSIPRPALAETEKPVAGIVLAAGSSQRLGRPKQLLRLHGKSLIAMVLEAALASRLRHTFLVLGHEAARITEALGSLAHHRRLTVVNNTLHGQGQATSLHAGLRAAENNFAAAMFLMCDQPLLDEATIDRLLEQFQASPKDICVPVCGGQRRNPAIFSERFFEPIFSIGGDTGARALIDNHPEAVLRVEFEDPTRFLDVDDEGALEKLRQIVGNAQPPHSRPAE